MAESNSRFITWNWGEVNQDTDPRYLKPADLVRMKNCIRNKRGRLACRPGVARAATISSTIGYVVNQPTAPVSMEASEETAIFGDDARSFWVRDKSSGKAHFAGWMDRAYPSWFTVSDVTQLGGVVKPLAVKTGSQIWTFALANLSSGVGGAYAKTVVSAAGEVIAETVNVGGASFFGSIRAFAACVDNAGVVNVLLAGYDSILGAQIQLHRWSSADQVTPTASTWHTAGTNVTITGIDAVNDAINNRLIVVAQTVRDSGGDRISGLIRTIGLPSGGVATTTSSVTSTGVGAAAKESTFGISILQDTGGFASGFYYIVFFQQHPGTPAQTQVKQQKVAVGAPGTVVDTTIEAFTMTNSFATGSCGGCINASGQPDLLYTFQDLFSTHKMRQPNKLLVRRCINNGTPFTQYRSSSLASKPWFISGRGWFVAVHFNDWDDNGGGGRELLQSGGQNAYYVYNFAPLPARAVTQDRGNFACGVLEGDSQAVSFFGTLSNGSDHLGWDYASHVVTPVDLGSSKIMLPLLSQGAARTLPGRVLATIDHAPSLHSSAPGMIPGGAVATLGPRDLLTEASPLLGPYSNFSFTGALGGVHTGTHLITYCYAFLHSNGDVALSPPYNLGPAPAGETFTAISTISMVIPSARHGLFGHPPVASNTGAPTSAGYIWIFGALDGETVMYFQDAWANDPTSDTTQGVLTPGNWQAGKTPALYTTGGGLPYVAPVACKVLWPQGARILGIGCDGEIWQSFEKRPGRAVVFNPGLNFTLPAGAGEPTAGHELDENSSIIFTATGTYVSTGNPDERAIGGTTVATVSRGHGCTNPAAVASHPLGVVFPDQKGRMQLYQPGTGLTPIYAGMLDSKDKTWVSAVDCPDEQLIRWQADDGTRLTLQYAYLPEDGSAPWGTWVVEDGLGLPTDVVGARLIDGVHTALDASDPCSLWSPDEDLWYDDTSATPVLINFKTGKNSPAGFMTSVDLDQFIFSVTRLGGNCTYDVTVTSDGTAGTSEVHHVDASAEPDFGFRAAVMRAREFDIEVQQVTATGKGHLWDGVVTEVKTDAKVRGVTPTRMIP